MFGIDSKNGILFQTAHYVLNKTCINISIIELDGNEQYDLIEGRNKIGRIVQAKCIPIESIEHFDLLIGHSIKFRHQKTTDQNISSSRSHYFILLRNDQGSSLMIADLAGFESPKNKADIKQTQFINSSLFDLNTMLMQISKGHVSNSKATTLTAFMGPYIKESNDTVILYHVVNENLKKCLEYIKDIAVSHRSKRPTRPPLLDISNNKRNKVK